MSTTNSCQASVGTCRPSWCYFACDPPASDLTLVTFLPFLQHSSPRGHPSASHTPRSPPSFSSFICSFISGMEHAPGISEKRWVGDDSGAESVFTFPSRSGALRPACLFPSLCELRTSSLPNLQCLPQHPAHRRSAVTRRRSLGPDLVYLWLNTMCPRRCM